MDYSGTGPPGKAQGDWSGATGDPYPAGAAYDINDESFTMWTPVGVPDIDLHFKTYVVVDVSISDLAIQLVSAPRHAKVCEVFEQTYRIQNLGLDTAENVVVEVGGTDQFDVISVQGVSGAGSPGVTLPPGESMLVTTVIKVTAFVPGESRDGHVGETVGSDVYPDIAIDPNADNNVLYMTVRLVSKQKISCGQ